ncbi:MAG TPA: UDP-3-O-[3-hydroxymyristoyl] N-acetylglucosamine deacetylase [Bacteroidales bacterium]|nr:MAG: UDP-3-O-[3-hydroxymyristoyl] N-acetylglucosamine deacetylase [Bacteroidetes bacterium GWF2_33_38]OFY76577.1 MAG: UDP-3-O-[3-hydroxymyristoyl] N-acetylglucosamine deacetylase [Bacteroidetes bacterium RIFOXYA12_FULL_33_9]OFY90108.1 MAG: UDP-3-O-[3-hydroxymyristoyl] N-acetylglucosamine deacetylase [Bacteroidetes bacterium RIFOXYA2_FULL_33_7]HBF88022.1 UDP-3-O-[3-hydroxymyristoyl] N-acetylglucosamine deacetylase [Bacteroidales bacterium]
MSDKQKTIQKEIKISGKGLHSGKQVELTFKPAPENHGYKFRRVDIEGQPIVNALLENVVDTSRGTTIEEKGAKVITVEHVLAAIYGLEIDNILIELNNEEVPIMDGSSKLFVEKLLEAGITEQNEDKKYYTIKNNVIYTDENNDAEIVIIPDSKLNVNVVIEYDSEIVLSQHAYLSKLSDFKNEIANCRTFVLLSELEILLKNNLIKGGDLSNAVVILDKQVNQEELDRIAKLFGERTKKLEDIKNGILNDSQLNYPNEPARHKILDILGDLALLGQPIKGRIIAKKTGHNSNVQIGKKLREVIKKENLKTNAPFYDINIPPIMDITQIKKLLPHRYPFLLVDKIIEMTDTTVIGVKNVTGNEEFFNGHFPKEPVMPGVLQIEAMAQVGGILVLSTVPDPENYTTLFLKIDGVRFKRKVVPGDTLVFKLEFISPLRRGLANMRGQAFVGDSLVAEGELLAQISKNI